MPYYPPRQYQQPEDHPPHKRNTLRRIILLASILLIAYGGVRLTMYGTDLAASRRTAQSLRELAAGTDGAAGLKSSGLNRPAGSGKNREESISGRNKKRENRG